MQQYGHVKTLRTTRVNDRKADKDMHINTYLEGFLGAKKRGKASPRKK